MRLPKTNFILHEALELVNGKCPLKILSISWDEYNLNVTGDRWNFNTVSSWRLINQNGLWGCMDNEATSYLERLENESILSIEQFSVNSIDLSITLSNNTVLQVFATTYLEPWIFRIEKEITFVASFPLVDD